MAISIKETQDSYLVCNLRYQGKPVIAELSKSLLNNGEVNHLEAWVGKETGIPSAKLYYAMAQGLFDLDMGKEAEGLKQLLQEDLTGIGEHKIIMSTRISYRKTSYALVRHFYRNKEWGDEIPVNMDRKNGFLDQGLEDVVEALFGTKDVKEVNEVFKWLTGKKPQIYFIAERNANAPPINIDFNLMISTSKEYCTIWANSICGGQARKVRLSFTN